jgi:hypothetical protein
MSFNCQLLQISLESIHRSLKHLQWAVCQTFASEKVTNMFGEWWKFSWEKSTPGGFSCQLTIIFPHCCCKQTWLTICWCWLSRRRCEGWSCLTWPCTAAPLRYWWRGVTLKKMQKFCLKKLHNMTPIFKVDCSDILCGGDARLDASKPVNGTLHIVRSKYLCRQEIR